VQQNDIDRPRVAVAGAGVVGLCTALQLIRAGYAVTLFDPQPPAMQTSFGNAAYLAAEYSDPLASWHNIRSALALSFSQRSAFKVTADHLPGFLPWALRFINAARPTQLERNRAAIRQLNAYVIDAWQDLLDFAAAREQMQNSGFLKLWEQAGSLPDAKKMQQSMASAGIESQVISGIELHQLEPALTPQIRHALLFPGAWQLNDPYTTCMALFNCFLENGGQFQQQGINTVRPDGEGAVVQAGHEKPQLFNQAVIAAGAWSRPLTKSLGISVPLAAERGYHLTLPDAHIRPRHILESVDRHVVLSSLESGLRIVGFGEYGRLNSKPRTKRYHQLARHLQALIREAEPEQQSVSEWMGIRPTLPDSLPVIDLHPLYPQIGFVFGHHHLGVTQAALSAKMMTTMLTEGKGADSLGTFKNHLSAYAVDRFS